MAINLQIYSGVNNTTKTVTVDFIVNIAAFTTDSTINDSNRYFFKFTTSAKDTSNLSYTPRFTMKLSDLALNGNKQSNGGSSDPYANIKSMVMDYVYDYIHGHTPGQSGSGCTAKAPMKFSS